MAKVHYSHCPLCNSDQINHLLRVKDYSVSQESFAIWQCSHCSLRFTQDIPDEASIGSYYQSEDYISHSNTSQGGVNRIYQKVRNYTLHAKAKLIRNFTVEKGRILDLGAGTGAFLATMKDKGWETQGIEPDEGAREIAKTTFHIELGETRELETLPNESFDAITLWHVLEHVHQLHPYVERLKNLLKPGGKLFVAVPNYTSLDNSIYQHHWAAYDVPRHLYHFTPRSIGILMQLHGLRVEEKKPMWFDSFYISLLSSRYKNGKESWIGAGLSGLRSNIRAIFNKDRCSSLIYIIGKDQRSN